MIVVRVACIERDVKSGNMAAIEPPAWLTLCGYSTHFPCCRELVNIHSAWPFGKETPQELLPANSDRQENMRQVSVLP
jgi:hypothetical protein